MLISFAIPSIPVAQPRPRATMAHGGKGARIHEVTHIKNPVTGERKPHPIAAFKATVRLAASQNYSGPPLEGPLSVVIVFVLPRPGRLIWKTRPMPRVWHESKPDSENLAKSTLDALTGILWRDDSQVAELALRKYVAAGGEQPSVGVTIRTLGGENGEVDLFGEEVNAGHGLTATEK